MRQENACLPTVSVAFPVHVEDSPHQCGILGMVRGQRSFRRFLGKTKIVNRANFCQLLQGPKGDRGHPGKTTVVNGDNMPGMLIEGPPGPPGRDGPAGKKVGSPHSEIMTACLYVYDPLI